MRREVLALIGALALFGVTHSAPARADGPVTSAATADVEGAEAEYHSLVDEALREYGSGHYEEARALFLRAHALQPSARTHRGIGLAEYELRNYPECIAQLEAALRSSERPLVGQVRAATQDVLQRANRYVARVTVRTTPSDAQIAVDRVPVAYTPGSPLVLRVGEHLLEARAEGYIPSSRVLTVLGGADLGVELVLAPIASTAAPAAPPQAASAPLAAPASAIATSLAPAGPQRDEGARRRYKSPWLWGAVGVVVVGAAVGAGVVAARSGGSAAAPDYPLVPGP